MAWIDRVALKVAQTRANAVANRTAYKPNKPLIVNTPQGKINTGVPRRYQRTTRKDFRYTRSYESFKTPEERKAYIKRLWSIQPYRDEQYRDNLIKALNNVYGQSGASELTARIREISIREFLRITYENNIEIEDVYMDEGADDYLAELGSYFGVGN